MKRCGPALLWAFFLLNASCGTDQTGFDFPAYGFAVGNPPQWHAATRDSLLLLSDPDTPQESFSASINFVVESLQESEIASDYAARVLPELTARLSELSVRGEAQIKLDGVAGIRRHYRFDFNERPIEGVQYYFARGDDILIITFMAEAYDFERGLVGAEAILRSIDFTEVTLYRFSLIPTAFAQTPNPMADALDELQEGLTGALKGFYEGIGNWVNPPPSPPPPRPPPPRSQEHFSTGELVMATGPAEVYEYDLAHYVFTYPQAYGYLLVFFDTTGNGEQVGAGFKSGNSYHLHVSAREEGSFTITARIRTSYFENISFSDEISHEDYTASWTIPVLKRLPKDCEDPAMYCDVCPARCESGTCQPAYTTEFGLACCTCVPDAPEPIPMCDPPTQERGACDATCEGECEYVYTRPEDQVSCYSCRPFPAECEPPSQEYMACRSGCSEEGTCVYVGQTADSACYICEEP